MIMDVMRAKAAHGYLMSLLSNELFITGTSWGRMRDTEAIDKQQGFIVRWRT